jgi:hypothetical protein
MIEAHLRLYIPGYKTVPTGAGMEGIVGADEGAFTSTDASGVAVAAGNGDDLS